MNIISLDNVSFSFKTKPIFDHFDLRVAPGEKVQIKGKSGTGKTTLFKLILGFVRPDKGMVLFNGEALDARSVWQARGSMAYVSQDMSIGEGRVKDFLADLLSYEANRKLNVSREQIIALFSEFSLSEDLYESSISNLSGGEKQRIAIIASILIDRPVYLLDEITSALDEALKKKIARYFMELKEKTILIISHDQVWEEYDLKVVDLDSVNNK